MFPRALLFLSTLLLATTFVACSSNVATEKQSEGLGRPKIMEEDITQKPMPQGQASPASSSNTPGFEKTAPATPTVPPSYGTSDPSGGAGKTPRRFQWKDNH